MALEPLIGQDARATRNQQGQQQGQQAKPKEKFYRVKFHDKSGVNDTEKVMLSVNGEVLQITRGVEVTIPHRYVECARNTYHNTYRQLPGETRKVTGRVMTYPFDIIGDGAEEDFQKAFREGTRKLKEELQLEGAGVAR